MSTKFVDHAVNAPLQRPFSRRTARVVETRSPDCLAALEALEHARREIVMLIRHGLSVSLDELNELDTAIEELSSLMVGYRSYMSDATGVPGTADPLAGEYVRVAVQSALEAMHRGDLRTARRRAEIAMWAARSSRSAEDQTWVIAILLDLFAVADAASTAPPEAVSADHC